jgi:hypothetical protein
LIHLRLRLSQGGLGAAHRDSAGANALEFIIDAVILARARSSGVGRTTSARIEGRLQKSVRSIFFSEVEASREAIQDNTG